MRLSEAGGKKQQNWMEGLFASHPPSQERVDQNRKTADELGRGGEMGTESFAAATKQLRQMKPAYDKYDQAVAAAQKKDFATAKSLAGEAVKAIPNEGSFQVLLGQIALAEKQPQAAAGHFDKAMQLSPNYFASYLGAGVAQVQLGNEDKAEQYLTRSARAAAHRPCRISPGQYRARSRRHRGGAKVLPGGGDFQSSIGQAAAAEYMKLDLPQNPGNYIAAGGQLDSQGQVMVVVQNRSRIALHAVQVTPVLVDATGRVVRQGDPVLIRSVVKPGEQAAAPTGIANLSQEQLQALRFRVDGAQIAE